MGNIDKREMEWVRGLFRTSNPDKRDIIGVYQGVMELVGINKALKKHIKCLKEVIRLKELKEPKEEDIDKKALAISALCGGGVELAIKILHHLKNIQTESPKEAPEVKVCEWIDIDSEVWKTSCGNTIYQTMEGLSLSEMEYCVKCGKKIKEAVK